MHDLIVYQQSGDLFQDAAKIIESAQQVAYRAVDRVLVLRNWLLGKRISENELKGDRQERYGSGIVDDLARRLTDQYGRGFDRRNLYRFVKFYQTYGNIVTSVSAQSLQGAGDEIVDSASAQSLDASCQFKISGKILTWTHYRILLQVLNPDAREWYEREAFEQAWSVRTLQRNIDTQYYDRMLLAHSTTSDSKPQASMSGTPVRCSTDLLLCQIKCFIL
ncbi:MAG: hypothetical protein J6I40_05255 [Mailhella sp.]|nr:hypothetical protein [Mailhella sp.]